jgi:hypothetical protein
MAARAGAVPAGLPQLRAQQMTQGASPEPAAAAALSTPLYLCELAPPGFNEPAKASGPLELREVLSIAVATQDFCSSRAVVWSSCSRHAAPLLDLLQGRAALPGLGEAVSACKADDMLPWVRAPAARAAVTR